MSKPSIPKGTRDFSPDEMLKREFIFEQIKDVFKVYGYQPIETPAMENLSTLLGKYGEEGDKLLFRILNSGNFLSGTTDEEILKRDPGKISSKICEKGLRYDLTVPFARYVVQHRDEIVFPFKRYQIQPVWRADRPQKGRYREFFQCDVDVIGSSSLLNEIELIQIIDDIFKKLNIGILIKINSRKILAGIADIVGAPERISDITVALDKIEKVGWEKVKEELGDKGISNEIIKEFANIIGVISLDNRKKIKLLHSLFLESKIGLEGIRELTTLFDYLDGICLKAVVDFDLVLARGLNYYTGTIIEVKVKDSSFGSICGGGRYDNLTGIFGLPGVSGVGVSFGADRIYDVMKQMNLFDTTTSSSLDILVLNFGDAEIKYALNIASRVRGLGLKSEIYPDNIKIGKQVSYANSKRIPYIIIAGEEEIKNNEFTLKVMATGEQKKIPLGDLDNFIREELALEE